MADEAGTKVNSYGFSPRGVPRSTTSETVTQPYRLADGYQDPTGLYRFAARYYDPNIGRFTNPDPSGQEQNPYLYAEGDPVNRIDPTGLFGWPEVGALVLGAAIGVVAPWAPLPKASTAMALGTWEWLASVEAWPVASLEVLHICSLSR
ncbi:RHS repeat-associated core domain-containing protein [Streptomyces sp. 840.1]|uniref:RHS repeat-associated core domain-containing protein n=1 Tax=Streptomyces sp. 840.1 TaxID=2485152 RepID=UPI0028898D5B|nr:RHS repeat-associated core domain-containing protein [Streptomyces sp. 840.1]